MNHKLTKSIGVLLLAATFSLNAEPAQNRVLEKVDPFIGTGFHGHTFPGATTPFGMVQLSPDTRTSGWDACGGYYDADTEIWGFSHTHLSGTGIGDYGDVLLMPFTGEVGIGSGTPDKPDYSYRSAFKKENQFATPGYYRVLLDRYQIKAELSATPRVGIHRYTFPKAAKAGVVVDLKHSIQNRQTLAAKLEVINDHEISGWRHMRGWAQNRWIYFHAEFSKPFTAELFVGDALQKEKASVTGKNVKARLNFATADAETVLVKVGISPVDCAGAKNNLTTEVPAWDFDGVVKQAAAAWADQLNRIQVKGGTADQQKVFATALYHTAICPNLSSDVDGRYRGMDQKIHQDTGYTNYTVFSLWDTFRAQHPLYTIINPGLDQAWIRALLRKHDEGGILPMWELAANYTGCMIGYHAVPVIVDAYVKGLRDYDLDKSMAAVLFASQYDDQKPIPYNSAEVRERLMPKAKLYNATKGFIPADLEVKSVSKALEFAYDDWAIATLASNLGREETAKEYFKRAGYYRQYFDLKTGFMRAKKTDGKWLEPFTPTDSNHKQGEYVEGNAWQWTWFVPHDVPGLMELFGGREKFAAKLNDLFTTSSILTGKEISGDITGLIGQYAHGNEPSHHIAYLFNWAEQPWRTAEIVSQIMTEFYQAAPAGLIGNEDCGQMSAWFVLSSIGIYQVCPGDPNFSLGCPLFDEARVSLPGGKTFVVKRQNASAKNKYVQQVTLDGQPLKSPFIRYADIMAGKELVFKMGDQKTIFWRPKGLAMDMPASDISSKLNRK
ncbi:MAG TPA: GH92 family glycosyl hydrolase [bacterium]|nr:GH92 family glycosyl hydrolase [bacterium]